MPRKQIVQFDAAGSVAATDRLLLQQGVAGTTFTHGTVTQLLNGSLPATFSTIAGTTGAFSGNFAVATNKFTVNATTGATVAASTITGTAFIPSASTVPVNGMYLPAANTLGWAVASTAEMQMTGTALSPAVSDGLALGTTTLMWSDAFFASGAVLNFNNGDVTLTHSADQLAFAGGKLRTLYNSTDASGATTIFVAAGDQSVAHTGNYFGADISPTFSATSGNTLAGLYGIYSSPGNTSTGTVTTLFGISAGARNVSSGVITNSIPISGITTNSGAGTITNAYGGRFRIDQTSTGTISNAYGVYSGLINSDAGGTVTNFFGLYLATPTNSGTIVNRWGVYQQDTASPNYFGGRTLVGGTTDDGSTALQVNGNAKSTGYFLRSVGSALTATGTTRADALQLAKEVNRLTTVASGTGVILPVGVVGMRIRIYQSGANPVKVYASASETIDGVAGATGVTLTNALRCEYEFVAANTWISAQLGAVSA